MQDVGVYSRTRQRSDRPTHRTWINRDKCAQISCRLTRVQLTGQCFHRTNSSLPSTIPNGPTGHINKNGDTLWMMGVLRSWYRRLHLISWRSLVRTDDAIEVVAPRDATGISNRRPQRCRVRLPTSGSTSRMSFPCL